MDLRRIRNRIKNRIKNKHGASLLYALLIMMVCVVIASVIITAGTVAAGRIATSIEMEQRYYAVNSAVALLKGILNEQEITVAQTKTTQTVGFYTIKINSDGALINLGTDTDPLYKEEFDFSKVKTTDGELSTDEKEYLSGHHAVNYTTTADYKKFLSDYGYMTNTEYAVLKLASDGTVTENITSFYSRSSDMILESALDYVLGSGRTDIETTTFESLQEFLAGAWDGGGSGEAQARQAEFTMNIDVSEKVNGKNVDVNTDSVAVTVKCQTTSDGYTIFTVTSGDGNIRYNYSVKLTYRMSVFVNEDNDGHERVGIDETQGRVEPVSTVGESGSETYIYRSNFTRLKIVERDTRIVFEMVSVENLMQESAGGSN